MDGLLLSGGADIEPARYGRPVAGSTDIEPDRDALEAEAWTAATGAGAAGPGHLSRASGDQRLRRRDAPPARRRPRRARAGATGRRPATRCGSRPGSRLARILFPTNPRGGALSVSTPTTTRPSAPPTWRRVSSRARGRRSPAGDLVEGLEAADGRFIIGVQCHPERTESTPPAFERLFAVFVDAARGPASSR